MESERYYRHHAALLPGSVPHFPSAPGWWVQWSGRTDWDRLTEHEGPLMKKILAGNGDKVVQIEAKSQVLP